jgi:hypothetical protein
MEDICRRGLSLKKKFKTHLIKELYENVKKCVKLAKPSVWAVFW